MIHFKFTAVGMKQMWDLTNNIYLIALKTIGWEQNLKLIELDNKNDFSSAAIEVVSEIDELCNIDTVVDYVYMRTGPKINTHKAPNVSKDE